MQFWVYILRCSDGSYYTGHTDDLDKRLAEHGQGLGADWTRRRRPVHLAWCADAPTCDEAFAFERRVKNWSRAKKEALVAGDWNRVGYFARPPHERLSDPPYHERPSTSLGTSGFSAPDIIIEQAKPSSLVASEGSPERSRRVEGRTR